MSEDLGYLTVEDFLEIAAGVLDDVVVMEVGLLAVAVGRPQLTVFGADACPTLEDKAAALLHSLVSNHAFVDGNERLAWTATRVFCILDGRDLTYSVDAAEALMLAAAAGRLDVPSSPDGFAHIVADDPLPTENCPFPRRVHRGRRLIACIPW